MSAALLGAGIESWNTRDELQAIIDECKAETEHPVDSPVDASVDEAAKVDDAHEAVHEDTTEDKGDETVAPIRVDSIPDALWV